MAECCDEGTEVKEERTFTVAGCSFPVSRVFNLEGVKKALSFRPQPSDVIMSSYPKSDSKCIETIVWKLLYPNLKLPPVNKITNRHLPCMEMTDEFDHLDGVQEYILSHKLPRLFKTYCPFKWIPFYKRAKYIYVIRAPWKVCTSYYHMLYLAGDTTEAFDEFFKNFLSGNVAHGCYLKHVSPWNKRSNENNVLVLCHEHVKNNPRSAMFTIAAFLGEGYLKRLMNCDELERNILKAIDGDQSKCLKKRSEQPMCLKDTLDTIYFCTLPKWQCQTKPVCSVEQIEEITEKISEKFKGSSVEHLWLSLLKKCDAVSLN